MQYVFAQGVGVCSQCRTPRTWVVREIETDGISTKMTLVFVCKTCTKDVCLICGRDKEKISVQCPHDGRVTLAYICRNCDFVDAVQQGLICLV